MNKSEFIDAIVAKNPKFTKAATGDFVDAAIEVVQETVASGERISFVGFGTFERKVRSARSGVNPATGKKIKIAEKNVPSFKAGKAFKDKVASYNS